MSSLRKKIKDSFYEGVHVAFKKAGETLNKGLSAVSGKKLPQDWRDSDDEVTRGMKNVMKAGAAIGLSVGAALALGPFRNEAMAVVDIVFRGTTVPIGPQIFHSAFLPVKGVLMGAGTGAVLGGLGSGGFLGVASSTFSKISDWAAKPRKASLGVISEEEMPEEMKKALLDFFTSVTPEEIEIFRAVVKEDGSVDEKKLEGLVLDKVAKSQSEASS